MAVILRYFSEFGSFRRALRKSSRSLSHLVMSSCTCMVFVPVHAGLYQHYRTLHASVTYEWTPLHWLRKCYFAQYTQLLLISSVPCGHQTDPVVHKSVHKRNPSGSSDLIVSCFNLGQATTADIVTCHQPRSWPEVVQGLSQIWTGSLEPLGNRNTSMNSPQVQQCKRQGRTRGGKMGFVPTKIAKIVL